MVRQGLAQIRVDEKEGLIEKARDYMQFRKTVDQFLHCHFNEVCTKNCYESRTSACCSKDGIITFFADTVINALYSTPKQLDCLDSVLKRTNDGHRCIYLGDWGCLWVVRPVVCTMFLCDRAMNTVFTERPEAKLQWERLRRQEKAFKWPDRPVLFDALEKVFIGMGYRSTLMHLNFSPGLLNVKKKAGLLSKSG